MRNPFADSYHWSKRIWRPNPFVVLLRKAQTDLAIRIWTILVPIRSKKPEKNGFGPFSYKFFVCIRVGLNGAPRVWAEKKYFVPKILMKQPHDCSYYPMGGRPNGALLKKTERKLKSPLGAHRITEQPQRHGSSARYIRDPMTQGYRPGGACRSCGTIPRKSSRSPGPFLVVSHLYYLDHSHNPSNTSCGLCPPIELGAGRLPYRRVCICVAHCEHCR